MALTAREQYLLELINRARLDPAMEAKRYNVALNEDLAPGTIDATAKQPLAPNELLHDAASAHSAWMLATNTFSHTGSGGSTPGDRMAAAGYTFTGSWSWGENIAWAGSTGAIDLSKMIDTHHRGLFRSAGHRENLLADHYKEAGVAQETGLFTSEGTTFNTSMVTENFAASGPASTVFVTGVVYDDNDGDDFYSIGEGEGGVGVMVNGSGTTSAAAGGYAVAVTAGWATVTFGGGITVQVDASDGNVKADLVDGSAVYTSADTILGSGATAAAALGVGNLRLTGNDLSNALVGNRGGNVLAGAGGNDVLAGRAGNDRIDGGSHSDILMGGGGGDKLFGRGGADTLFGQGGRDIQRGGGGADTFVFKGGFGRDRVKDFGPGDELWFDHPAVTGFGDLIRNHARDVAAGVRIDVGKHVVIVEDIDLDDLSASDFRFDDFSVA